MLTFLAAAKTPSNLDVQVNIQDIRSYCIKGNSDNEKEPALDYDLQTKSEGANGQFGGPRMSTQKRSFLVKMKYRGKAENIEWNLHSCKAGPENSWRKFLRDVGHEYISSTKTSAISLPKVTSPKEGILSKMLQDFPKLSKHVRKEEFDFEAGIDRTLDDDSLTTTEKHSTNLTLEMEASKNYADRVGSFDPPVDQKMLTDFNLIKALYFGEWSALNMHGYGSYVLSLGSRYSGEMKEGMFYGNGILYYPCGSRIEGEWIKGVLNPRKRKYIFYDGLEFKEANWGYIRGYDHRFHSEKLHGLLPGCEFKMTNSGVQHCIPIGWYDVAEGYFNPHTKAVMSYDTEDLPLGDGTTHSMHKLIRITDREEMKWIMKNCRKEEDKVVGFQQNMSQYCYESGSVQVGTQSSIQQEEKTLDLEESAEESELPSSSATMRRKRQTWQTVLESAIERSSENEEENIFSESTQILIANNDVRTTLISEDGVSSLDPIPKDISTDILKMLGASFHSKVVLSSFND